MVRCTIGKSRPKKNIPCTVTTADVTRGNAVADLTQGNVSLAQTVIEQGQVGMREETGLRHSKSVEATATRLEPLSQEVNRHRGRVTTVELEKLKKKKSTDEKKVTRVSEVSSEVREKSKEMKKGRKTSSPRPTAALVELVSVSQTSRCGVDPAFPTTKERGSAEQSGIQSKDTDIRESSVEGTSRSTKTVSQVLISSQGQALALRRTTLPQVASLIPEDSSQIESHRQGISPSSDPPLRLRVDPDEFDVDHETRPPRRSAEYECTSRYNEEYERPRSRRRSSPPLARQPHELLRIPERDTDYDRSSTFQNYPRYQNYGYRARGYQQQRGRPQYSYAERRTIERWEAEQGRYRPPF